jgi:hypothetical protein
MRSNRAFLGAFTGGVVLAIAASVALLAVSSVIAFRGWPESDTAPKDPEVAQLRAVRAQAAQTSATVRPVALPRVAAAAPARRRVAAKNGRRHAVRAHGRKGVVRSRQTASATPDRGSPATSSAPNQAADDTTSSGGQVQTSKSDPAKPVADAVGDTTKAAADAVAPVAPPVSGALQSLGGAGADTVDKSVDTAGKVVSGVLGGG